LQDNGAHHTGSDAAKALSAELERYRTELTGYSYRMLGSSFDAEDAVQETLVRAWRGFESFAGRSALKSWLYRIATNVCIDMLNARQRRALPMDFGPAATAQAQLGAPLSDATWIEPAPDSRVLPTQLDPSELIGARETVRLAFVAALQLLPPLQRAVLILREVLHFSASEVAELLDTSVAATNSALQRARATLSARDPALLEPALPDDDVRRSLLVRYVDAFERWDVDGLIALLHEDATLSMPPFALWLRGREQVRRWFLGPGAGCRGSHLVVVAANGAPAIAQYKVNPSGPGHVAFAVHVLELAGSQIVGQCSFLDAPRVFPLFGLPMTVD
jgi:RNA polymerase sigma-70 factor, ECF subfamily